MTGTTCSDPDSPPLAGGFFLSLRHDLKIPLSHQGAKNRVEWCACKTLSCQQFSAIQHPAKRQVYAAHNEIRRSNKAMNDTEQTTPAQMVWAVLAKGANGRSEVVKITTADEADRAVLSNPSGWYKSGPVLLA
jgi:hypothetical protein